MVRLVMFRRSFRLRRSYHGPTVVRIVLQDARSLAESLTSEILFVYDTVFVDDECHDAAGSILRRVRDKCESARHIAVNDVTCLAARRSRTLARKDPEVIAPKRRCR